MPIRFRLAHYEISEELGQGGMGVVYLAKDTRLGRQLAIKVLPSLLRTDPERRGRFLREARAAAGLNHPNIATVYEVGESTLLAVSDPTDGEVTQAEPATCLYIAMELVPGEDLHDRLARGRMALGDALDIAVQIVDGLDCAHKAGVIHRDLKPRNIRITPEGRVKILDFGLAKVLQEEAGIGSVVGAGEVRTMEGMIVGTVPYMAPEQIEGKRVDARSDLFAFGVVLYQMVAGCLPFPGPNLVQYVRNLAKDPPLPLAEACPDAPPGLVKVVDRLLARESAERYASAEAALRDLRALVGSENLEKEGRDGLRNTARPVRTDPSRSQGRENRRIRRIALVSLLLFTGIGLLWVLRSENHAIDWSDLARTISVGTFSGDVQLGSECVEWKATVVHELKEQDPNLLVLDQVVAWAGRGGEGGSPRIWLTGVCTSTSAGAGLHIQLVVEPASVILLDEVFRPRTAVEDKVLHEVAFVIRSVLGSLKRFGEGSLDETDEVLRITQQFVIGVRLLEGATSDELLDIAKQHFQECLERLPDNPAVLGRVNELLALQWRDLDEEEKELLARLSIRAFEEDPDDIDSLLAAARSGRLAGDYRRALELVNGASDRYPFDPRTHYEASLILRHGGAVLAEGIGLSGAEAAELASEEIRIATRLRPGFWRYWNDRGAHALRVSPQGMDEPGRFFGLAVELSDPRIPSPRENLARVQAAGGDVEAAIETMVQVPEQERTASFEDNLGALLFSVGRYAEAIRFFRRATVMWPENGKFLADLGDALTRIGDLQGARDAFERAVGQFEAELDAFSPSWREGNLAQPRQLLRASERLALLAKLRRCAQVQSAVEPIQSSFREHDPDHRVPFALARAYSACERPSAARHWLEESFKRGLPSDYVRLSVEFDGADWVAEVM